jgi:hypothetical protein
MTPVILTKLGICQNISRQLTFLSSYFGGLDLTNLFIEQGTGQLELLIHHNLRSPGMVGALLFNFLGWFQFTASVSYGILTKTSTSVPHLKG